MLAKASGDMLRSELLSDVNRAADAPVGEALE
jgi:hypothetical protein